MYICLTPEQHRESAFRYFISSSVHRQAERNQIKSTAASTPVLPGGTVCLVSIRFIAEQNKYRSDWSRGVVLRDEMSLSEGKFSLFCSGSVLETHRSNQCNKWSRSDESSGVLYRDWLAGDASGWTSALDTVVSRWASVVIIFVMRPAASALVVGSLLAYWSSKISDWARRW